jgi:hypothetical protein
MTVEEQSHVKLPGEIASQHGPLPYELPRETCIYMNDDSRFRNEKFAGISGYDPVKKWDDAGAPLANIIEEDRGAVVAAYRKASESMAAICVDVRVRNIKTHKIINTTMVVTPMNDTSTHVFTVHFINRK